MGIGKIRLLIAASDPLARTGLVSLFENRSLFTVVGQVSGGTSLLNNLDIFQPDLLLFDLGWNPEASLSQLAQLGQPEIPTVALLPDESAAPDAWETGVKGLLLRQAKIEQIEAALMAASAGLITIAPNLAGALIPATSPASNPALTESLTPRETEVLHLLAQGLPNKAIALHLEISEHTVKFHVNAIMGKMQAQSRTEAVVRASQMGLIML